MANMLQRQFRGQVVSCGKLKTLENFKQLSLKVVDYDKWSYMRPSIYSEKTAYEGELLTGGGRKGR